MKIEEIEAAIEVTTKRVNAFSGNRVALIIEVINPFQSILNAGIKAGLFCGEKRIKNKFSQLQKALQRFDERASKRAMRLSEIKTK